MAIHEASKLFFPPPYIAHALKFMLLVALLYFLKEDSSHYAIVTFYKRQEDEVQCCAGNYDRAIGSL